ncbi:hypothetical protein ACFHYQ_24235 [Sphaerimonospora cavernae]|uniref:Uncharacterized protein n=1 Tax=Sphaerimonospora cavernae TaxID=1740611 RepID=A0ABV6UB35_9ACTN
MSAEAPQTRERGAVPPAKAGIPRPGAAVSRLPLLAGAMLSVIAGLWGGLSLLGTGVPVPNPTLATQHGPLMALGFLGTLISLERAVALGRPWGYAAPALAGIGALAGAAGFTRPGQVLLTAAAGWFLAVYLVLLARRPGREVVVQMCGAIAWYIGGLLWLRGLPVADLVPWLMAFLVLTIAGERLELAHVGFLPHQAKGRRASDGILAAMGVLGAGVLASVPWPVIGWRVAGLGMVALAGLLTVHDIARRTVRSTGLPRFAAVCLLSGYAWLTLAGALWAVFGRPETGGLYDASLHAVFLGFVMSMVFGHAPVILPAVLRVRLPYHPMLYGPLALLHAALLVRIAGDVGGLPAVRTVGGVLGEVSLLAFAGCAVLSGRLVPTRRTGVAGHTGSARQTGPAHQAGAVSRPSRSHKMESS